jgi:hypothetical protein
MKIENNKYCCPKCKSVQISSLKNGNIDISGHYEYICHDCLHKWQSDFWDYTKNSSFKEIKIEPYKNNEWSRFKGKTFDQPCLFDQFPNDGKTRVLGLSCPCPKCSPRC